MDQAPSTGRESAKQRARRIPLDYHRHSTSLDRAKWRLTWIAAIAAGLYVAWLVAGWQLGWRQAARQASPGPLASAHAAWDSQCAACHVTGANVRSDASAIALLAAPIARGDGTPRQVSDGRCIACHAGPAHHDNQIAAEVVSCAACHRDHHGPDANLTRVADAVCTACHRNLNRHREAGKDSVAQGEPFENVTNWRTHPEFRSIGGKNQASFVDPGRLKFNHALHMLPGQAPVDAVESAKKKWGAIKTSYWAGLMAGRTDKFAAETPVQLNCGSCHQLDDSSGTTTIPSLGAYMQPIRFQQHCAPCHGGELLADADPSSKPPLGQIPHGLKAAEIRQFISGLLSPLQSAQPLSPMTPLQPIPGKTPGENAAQTIKRDAAARLALAETQLLGEHRCGKCHEFRARDTTGMMPQVEPTATPSVWLKHARFDHAAHRAVTCYECHSAKYFEPSASGDRATKPPLDGQSPMIPGRAICAKCHGQSTEQGTKGARFDCVECHRYHGGDLGPHGHGAPGRGVPPERKHDLRQFISGGLNSGSSAANPAAK